MFDLASIRKFIDLLFRTVKNILPNTRLAYSEILPRKYWRYSWDNEAMERNRKRVNSFAGKQAIKLGGFYVRHPALSLCPEKYLDNDGVHLNSDGNKLFLLQIKKAIVEGSNGKSIVI